MGMNKSLNDAPKTNGNKSSTCSSNDGPFTSSPMVNSNAAESTDSLLTPPSIHISHMYVYNFTPDQKLSQDSSVFSTLRKSKYQSPAASSGPICRICHEGDVKEDLVSPCRCTGTVGLVHKSCMERWLSTRFNTNDKCEICNYTFVTSRQPKSILEWIRSEEESNHRRSLFGDVTCFFLLTPLAVVSSYLCIEGAKRQVSWGNSLEAGCLMALATFLITIYFVWNILTLRFHLRNFWKWRSRNQNVKLLRVQRVSADLDTSPRSLEGMQVVPLESSNQSPSVTIVIEPGQNISRNR